MHRLAPVTSRDGVVPDARNLVDHLVDYNPEWMGVDGCRHVSITIDKTQGALKCCHEWTLAQAPCAADNSVRRRRFALDPPALIRTANHRALAIELLSATSDS